jgi:hypothetical protein
MQTRPPPRCLHPTRAALVHPSGAAPLGTPGVGTPPSCLQSAISIKSRNTCSAVLPAAIASVYCREVA